MASIRKEILIKAPPEQVWDVVRDYANVHQRLVPGVLTDTRMDGDARIVSFANGMVVRELIVDVDDKAQRFVWAAVGGVLSHHNASMQVFSDGAGSKLVWIADLLPNTMAAAIGGLMEQGSAVIKQTLERAAA